MVLVGHRAPVGRVGCVVGEEPEVLGATDRGCAHEPDGLAGVDAFDGGDLVGSLDDQIGDVVQDPLALVTTAPRPVAERVGRRPRGRIDVGGPSRGDGAEQRTVDRRMVVERLAARARRRLTVDQVQQGRVGEARQLRGRRGAVLVERAGGCHASSFVSGPFRPMPASVRR